MLFTWKFKFSSLWIEDLSLIHTNVFYIVTKERDTKSWINTHTNEVYIVIFTEENNIVPFFVLAVG